MARVKLIHERTDVAPEQYELFDTLATRRGRISGPSSVVLYSPGLARVWNEIGEYLHGLSPLQGGLSELAVIATARHYDCAYIWSAHVRQARDAGISEQAIVAVKDGGSLDGLPAEEAAVVRYVRQILSTNRVESDAFEALLGQHDARWMVDLTSWIGRYGALAGILNAFEVEPLPDADALPSAPPANASGPARPLAPQTRTPPLASREQVAEAGRAVFDAVAEGRGNVRGPFAMLMYSPALCQRILDLSNYLRLESLLTPRLRELATIAIAREKDCPYVWAAHAPAARKEGIDDAVIETIRVRGDLAALLEPERDIVEYARQWHRAHRIQQPLFDRLSAQGTAWLVELTALIGHYAAVTALLNATEVTPLPGTEALD